MSSNPSPNADPVPILQRLIQFNTTNPPGHEAACIRYANDLLRDAGIETTIVALDDDRPNLIARIPGRGDAPPLLMYGHVDVVTTENQDWEQEPFSGEIIDDYIWGRGALDMKGGVAMMLSAFLSAHQNGTDLPGDVILALVSDEEAGGDYGAKFLAEKHGDLFVGVKYAIGEFGGFTLSIAGKTFYPIMTGEKQICHLRATIKGPAGHGSMPVHDGAMAALGSFLTNINRNQLPVHITPIVREMFEMISKEISFPLNMLIGQLLNPLMTDAILKLMGEQGYVFAPLFHNTVSPTILKGSSKINVIPGEVTVELDGRILPGYTPDDLIKELHDLADDGINFEVVRFDPGPPQPAMNLFETLSMILKERDPEGIPIPLLLSGATDARHFASLGIQTYGYLPMKLPEDFNFGRTIHAADERIPVEAVRFGTSIISDLLGRFGLS